MNLYGEGHQAVKLAESPTTQKIGITVLAAVDLSGADPRGDGPWAKYCLYRRQGKGGNYQFSVICYGHVGLSLIMADFPNGPKGRSQADRKSIWQPTSDWLSDLFGSDKNTIHRVLRPNDIMGYVPLLSRLPTRLISLSSICATVSKQFSKRGS